LWRFYGWGMVVEDDEIEMQFLGIVRNYDKKEKLIDNGGSILWYRDVIVWLPRQDQLQEMIYSSPDMEEVVKFAIKVHQNDVNTEYYLNSGSLEQLWLKYVMKEKFNKTWNGEDWV